MVQRSMAAYSPPGSWSTLTPMYSAIAGAVWWWSTYSIFGSACGGSLLIPTFSGEEMSIRRRGMTLLDPGPFRYPQLAKWHAGGQVGGKLGGPFRNLVRRGLEYVPSRFPQSFRRGRFPHSFAWHLPVIFPFMCWARYVPNSTKIEG